MKELIEKMHKTGSKEVPTVHSKGGGCSGQNSNCVQTHCNNG